MLDDVAFELREDQQYDLAAKVFAFDYVNAESDDFYKLSRELKRISRWVVGDTPEILEALTDLYDALAGMGTLFYLVRTDKAAA
jgi:hypothetical protein